MTETEAYIEGQKASGIEVGDTVRVWRGAESREGGWGNSWNVSMEVGGELQVLRDRGEYGITLNDRFELSYPYFVLEIVKKANGTVPEQIKGRGATCVVLDEHATLAGDSKMKTQEIYSVVVTENEHVKDAETTQIIATKKRVIYKESAMSAYSSGNAQVKAILAAAKVKGVTAIKDEDELEVKVSSPF